MAVIREIARRTARAILGLAPPSPSEEQAYRRLSAKGFRPAGILDIGAYEGNWTRLARRVFPSTPVLMVEPQAAKRSLLEATCEELPMVSFVSALLGARAGEEVMFYVMETGSSMLAENSNVQRTECRFVTRVLDEVAGEMEGPLFLKLDVQGAELRVLEGGSKTLELSEVVQLEVAMLPYNQGAPTYLETIDFMDQRGFVPFDFSGFTRPNGVDLAQVDILFARRTSPLRPTFFRF